MRLAVAVTMLLSLGACAEVTTFRNADGSVYYHVNCGETMKLESCHHAAERTCPGGYARRSVSTSNSNDPAARCASENASRREAGEDPVPCPPSRNRDSYFTCR